MSVPALVFHVTTAWIDVPTGWGIRGSASLFALTCGSVGVVVASRRPENIVGWMFSAIGILFAIQSIMEAYAVASYLVVVGGLPAGPLIAWCLSWWWAGAVGIALIFLPLVFPTGRMLSVRWRAVAWFGTFGLVAFGLVVAFIAGPIPDALYTDNPFGLIGTDVAGTAVTALSFLIVVLAIVLAMTSLVRRFRAGDEDTRRQIKWFALAGSMAGAAFAGYVLAYLAIGSPTLTNVLEILVEGSLLAVPVAAGLAILRYRLYDIDRIVSRSIAYGLMTAILIGAYGAAILVLQGPLSAVTGSDTILVALSTLIVAALFQPLRRRVQGAVDRRFDRARFDAERTAAAFAERLRNEVDIATVTRDLDRTVRGAMRPEVMGLWLRGPGR
jgi:hypothetical protein